MFRDRKLAAKRLVLPNDNKSIHMRLGINNANPVHHWAYVANVGAMSTK